MAWYLASEICERFYASHGIRPVVIDHDDGDYYGILLRTTQCSVHGDEPVRLGRFTIAGNVENWRTGGPGDHGLELVERVMSGEPVEPMVAEAIRHLQLSPFPEKTHMTCRHKRWGDSFKLVFKLTALLALRHQGRVVIWSDEYHTDKLARKHDPHAHKKEQLGHVLLYRPEVDQRILIAYDGRIVLPEGQPSLFERHMSGEPTAGLLADLDRLVGLRM